jgi:hypothetical protein
MVRDPWIGRDPVRRVPGLVLDGSPAGAVMPRRGRPNRSIKSAPMGVPGGRRAPCGMPLRRVIKRDADPHERSLRAGGTPTSASYAMGLQQDGRPR